MQDLRAGRILDRQAVVPEGVAVGAACDQGHVVAVLGEPGADHAADPTRTEHDEPHGPDRTMRPPPAPGATWNPWSDELEGAGSVVEHVTGVDSEHVADQVAEDR